MTYQTKNYDGTVGIEGPTILRPFSGIPAGKRLRL
jgi:hypothetical protein